MQLVTSLLRTLNFSLPANADFEKVLVHLSLENINALLLLFAVDTIRKVMSVCGADVEIGSNIIAQN
jgi:hypothetical protein